MIPFKRILVSKEKQKDKDAWEKSSFGDELKEKIFTLEDCGEMCDQDIKSFKGKKVIVSDSRGTKVKEENDLEYFILPQETVLMQYQGEL